MATKSIEHLFFQTLQCVFGTRGAVLFPKYKKYEEGEINKLLRANLYVVSVNDIRRMSCATSNDFAFKLLQNKNVL